MHIKYKCANRMLETVAFQQSLLLQVRTYINTNPFLLYSGKIYATIRESVNPFKIFIRLVAMIRLISCSNYNFCSQSCRMLIFLAIAQNVSSLLIMRRKLFVFQN